MKTAKILCFGDSNTWGTKPDGGRYEDHERWSFLLGAYLNMAALQERGQTAANDSIEISSDSTHESDTFFLVIEAGQPNRTLVKNAPFDGDKSGVVYLKPLLEVHQPDVLIILLGTNDLKAKFDLSADEIASAAFELISQTQALMPSIKVILLAPPMIKEVAPYLSIYAGGENKSQKLALEYEVQAKRLGCYFSDANKMITSSDLDGIHWDMSEHERLAVGLAARLKNWLD